jgi:hypothetical protein
MVWKGVAPCSRFSVQPAFCQVFVLLLAIFQVCYHVDCDNIAVAYILRIVPIVAAVRSVFSSSRRQAHVRRNEKL